MDFRVRLVAYFVLVFRICSAQEDVTEDDQFLPAPEVANQNVDRNIMTYYCDKEICSPIYEDTRNSIIEDKRKLRYYVFPQTKIDLNSIEYKSLKLFNTVHYVQFRVHLFDQCFLQKVAAHIAKVTKFPIRSHQVIPYDLGQVRLALTDEKTPAESNRGLFSLPKTPVTQPNRSPNLLLKVYTNDRDQATTLWRALRDQSELFDFFRLEYSLNSNLREEKERKLIEINMDNVRRTKVYRRVDSRMDDSRWIHLHTDDLFRIVQQTTQNVLIGAFRDQTGLVANFDDTATVRKAIREAISPDDIITVYNERDQRWNSAFWQKEWTRPDRLLRFLRRKFKLHNGNFTYDAQDVFNYLRRYEGSPKDIYNGLNVFGLNKGGATVKFMLDADDNIPEGSGEELDSQVLITVSEERMRQWLTRNQDNIEWTFRRRFKLKPTKLVRVDLEQLRSEPLLTVVSVEPPEEMNVDGNIRLHPVYPNDLICNPVDEPEVPQFENSVDREVRELDSEGRSKLDKLEERLLAAEELAELAIANCSREMRSLKDESNEFRDLLFKQEESQNSINTMFSEFQWLRDYSYCIWKNGQCPPGFKAVSTKTWLAKGNYGHYKFEPELTAKFPDQLFKRNWAVLFPAPETMNSIGDSYLEHKCIQGGQCPRTFFAVRADQNGQLVADGNGHGLIADVFDAASTEFVLQACCK